MQAVVTFVIMWKFIVLYGSHWPHTAIEARPNLVCCKYKAHTRFWRLSCRKRCKYLTNYSFMLIIWWYSLDILGYVKHVIKINFSSFALLFNIWPLADLKLYVHSLHYISVGQWCFSRCKTRDDDLCGSFCSQHCGDSDWCPDWLGSHHFIFDCYDIAVSIEDFYSVLLWNIELLENPFCFSGHEPNFFALKNFAFKLFIMPRFSRFWSCICLYGKLLCLFSSFYY